MQTGKGSTLKYWMVSKNVNEANTNTVLCMNVPLYMTASKLLIVSSRCLQYK
jgi:hypothetical protein